MQDRLSRRAERGLAALPDGGAFGEEGGEALLLVGGGAEPAEDVGFGVQRFGKRLGFATLDGFEDAGDGERRHGRDSVSECAGAGQEFSSGDEFIDEAHPKPRARPLWAEKLAEFLGGSALSGPPKIQ